MEACTCQYKQRLLQQTRSYEYYNLLQESAQLFSFYCFFLVKIVRRTACSFFFNTGELNFLYTERKQAVLPKQEGLDKLKCLTILFVVLHLQLQSAVLSVHHILPLSYMQIHIYSSFFTERGVQDSGLGSTSSVKKKSNSRFSYILPPSQAQTQVLKKMVELNGRKL